ncbi:hypothetical protein [Peredibacter starrii]|uniref:Uncharacterized protein n=1 Tax=Peredibacter starrii TaxID=28202 RepID=A0AAX4HTC5_9BACT|nr:hypothetical protein [Peredibacter starrii]WPU66640.1 hypothetical protein SOO65_07770 [Peredibacter starrii]
MDQNYVTELLKLKSNGNAKFSDVFVNQIEDFLWGRKFNIFQITDVIERIENGKLKSIKGIRQFKKEPLKGYSYAHWTDARFIAQNLLNHWSKNDLKEKIKKVCEDNGLKPGDPISPKLLNPLTYMAVQEAYFDRSNANEMTGEWIIFENRGGVNHYLTIAFHTERDHVIKERIDLAKFDH